MAQKHAEILNSLNQNSSMVLSYFKALTSFLNVLTLNPNEVQKDKIKQAAMENWLAGLAIVKSQPGLENIDTDTSLLLKPENEELSRAFHGLELLTKAIIANPESGLVYFTNSVTADGLARFTILVSDISKRVQATQKSSSKIKHSRPF
jgi:hypothetical protein